jgi:hypothetical protein
VARGTQHRKRRPPANAAVATQTAARPKRPKRPAYEEQLFFGRLRKHGRVVFVVLAGVFIISFVFLGVGSGSTGIGSVVENFFSGSSSSGSSLSSLQAATVKSPKDAAAWLAYATKLQEDKKLDEAAQALTTYTTLKPKDANGLNTLAGIYEQRANDWYTLWQDQQSYVSMLAPSPLLSPKSGSALATAIGTITNPLSTAVATEASTNVSTAYQEFESDISSWENTYKKLGALQPNNATTQLALAQAAAATGDSATEITAYKAFLRLAPNDSQAPAARKALKAAEKAQAKSAAASAAAKSGSAKVTTTKPKAKSSSSKTTTDASTTTTSSQ